VELNAEALRFVKERIEALPHGRIIGCYLELGKHQGERSNSNVCISGKGMWSEH